jgi:hypothetical protein
VKKRGSARAGINQPKSGSNISKNGGGGGGGGDGGSSGSVSGNGNGNGGGGGNGGGNAAAMTAVTVAPTAAEAGTDVVQRLSLVICIPVSYSVITIDRRIVNTLFVLAKNNIFWQTIKCFGKTLKFFGKT